MVEFSEDEKVIMKLHPSLKPAFAEILLGILFLILSIYYYINEKILWLIFSIFGSIFFFIGLADIYKILRTTYYITNLRVLKEYKKPFELEIIEIPINKIRGIETRKNFWETIFGLGHVVVASGAGRYFEIKLKHISSPEKVAEEIRKLV